MARFPISCLIPTALAVPVLVSFTKAERTASLAELQRFVAERNVAALLNCSDAALRQETGAFDFLRTNGAYGGGSRGWQTVLLRDEASQRDLFVVHAPLGCEDIGVQVFELKAGKLASKIREAENFATKLPHHNFKIQFDIPGRRAAVTDEFRLVPSGTGPKSVLLRLGSHFKVSSLKLADGTAVPFSQAGGVIAFARPSAATTYTMAYDGMVNLPFVGGMTRSDEILLAGDLWAPTLGRQPATFRAEIHAPANWEIVCQGNRISEKKTANESVATYDMPLPNCFFSLSAGKYRTKSLTRDGFTLRTASLDMTPAEMQLQNEVNWNVFKTLKRFAPYPFKEFTFLESRCMFGGALEAYSYATYMDNWLPDEEPHEPSHSWFGGIRANNYLTSLWNESFADWFEHAYLREGGICPPVEARPAQVDVPIALQSFDRIPVAKGSSEAGPDSVMLGYSKGSYVLQMLEWLIGPEKMTACIQKFLGSQPPGTLAEWPDFEAAVAEVTGTSYQWFFDQWLRRAGVPNCRLRDSRWEAGKFTVRVDWVGPTYRLPVDAWIKFADGSETTVRTVISGNSVVIPLAKRPKIVQFDPRRRTLRQMNAEDYGETLSRLASRVKRYVPASAQGTDTTLVGAARPSQMLLQPPSSAKDLLVVVEAGDERWAPYLKKAGIQLTKDTASWKGTTVSLKRGAFCLLVPVDGNGWLALLAGKTRLPLKLGQAQLGLFDEFGRLVRARTDIQARGSFCCTLP